MFTAVRDNPPLAHMERCPFYFSTDHVMLCDRPDHNVQAMGKMYHVHSFTILSGPFKTSPVFPTVLHASCNLETSLNGMTCPSLNVELRGFSILDSSKKIDIAALVCFYEYPRPRPPISLSLQSQSVMVKPCCRPLSETPCSFCAGQFS